MGKLGQHAETCRLPGLWVVNVQDAEHQQAASAREDADSRPVSQSRGAKCCCSSVAKDLGSVVLAVDQIRASNVYLPTMHRSFGCLSTVNRGFVGCLPAVKRGCVGCTPFVNRAHREPWICVNVCPP